MGSGWEGRREDSRTGAYGLEEEIGSSNYRRSICPAGWHRDLDDASKSH